MSKTKKWLIAGALLTVAGLIIFSGALAASDWRFDVLSTNKYQTTTYEISDDFYGISVDTDTVNIAFSPSQDGKCKVVCFEDTRTKHSVSVENAELFIKAPSKKWYEHIGINFNTPKITVYLPKTEYATLFVNGSTGDIDVTGNFKFSSADIRLSTGNVSFLANASGSVKIKTSTGNIRVEGISVQMLELGVSTGKISVSDTAIDGNVSLSVSTGKTELKNIECEYLSSSGSTGRIELENVIAKEKLCIERSTGDVKLDGCDAGEIYIKTDTGDVKGTLLSDKIFFAETDTGDIDVPKSTTGGKCEIETDTGDIKIGFRQ